MKKFSWMLPGVSLVVFFAGVCFAAAAGKAPEKSGAATVLDAKEYKLANKSIARTVSWADGKLATKSIENLLAEQTYSLEGDEFDIRLDGLDKPVTAASAKVTGAELQNIEGGKRLVVNLTDSALEGTVLRVVYELKDADFFGRKWIEIDPPEGKKLPVASLAVESLKFPTKATCSYQRREKGQPVYIDDNLFLGLEWPHATNAFNKNLYSATHWPAWDVEKGFCSKRAVWGAAPVGEVSHWFIEKYVPVIRLAHLPGLQVVNDGYFGHNSGTRDIQKSVACYRDNLVKKYGVQLDTYWIFGWDNGSDILELKTPDEFKAIRNIIETNLPGCHLGLYWPFCGTPIKINQGYIQKYGYEATSNAYCTVGTNFIKSMEEKIRHNIVDLGVNYFQDDSYKFGPCMVAGHGHRIEGNAALESQVEGKMRYFRFIKNLNPNVFIMGVGDCSCSGGGGGLGYSPWWLAGGFDNIGGYLEGNGAEGAASLGVGSRRERWINIYDYAVNNTCGNNRRQVPPNAVNSVLIKHFGNVSVKKMEEWEHDVLMCAGRGSMIWGLAIHSDVTTDEEWAFLAKTINWARTNADILANNTRFLLGKVQAEEPYGYSHSKDDRCIVFLRNPSLPDSLNLKDGWKVLPASKEDDIPKDFAAADFDDGAWQKVDDLGKYKPEDNAGYLLYRYRFNAPAEWKGKRIFLFGMMGTLETEKDVFLNGNALPAEVGGQNGGDVSEALAYGAENVLAVRLKINPRAVAKKLNGPVRLANLDAGSTVPFTLDPATSGFDLKYKHATVKWIYPEERTEPKTLEVGKPVNFAMKPFDVLVFELKLE